MRFKRLLPVLVLLTSSLSLASPAQDLFNEVIQILSNNYGGFSAARPAQLRDQYQPQLAQACGADANCPRETAVPVIRALISGLNDRHTRYMTPAEYNDFQARMRGTTSERPQLGVILQTVDGLDGLLIAEVSSGSPAEEAGLRRGDRILLVDGDSLPANPDDRVPFLRERIGQGRPLTLSVQRVQERLELRVLPRQISLQQLPSVSLRPDGVALLRIPSFTGYRQVGPRVHELVLQAQQSGAKAIVVDLRNNGGGLLSECLVGAGAFVDEVYRRLRQPGQSSDQLFRSGTYYTGFGSSLNEIFTLPSAARWRGPTIVLVNDRTASCAEYFAFDLQEGGKFKVIGSPTAGVGNTATIILRLRDGSGLQVTTSQAQRRDGTPYPDQVTPDIALADDWRALAEGRDVMLDRAVELVLNSAEQGAVGR